MQGRGQQAIFAALRAGLAVSAVAQGTGPADLTEWRQTGGTPHLPPLPDVPLHLIAAPVPRAHSRRAEAAILQLLPQLTRLPG